MGTWQNKVEAMTEYQMWRTVEGSATGGKGSRCRGALPSDGCPALWEFPPGQTKGLGILWVVASLNSDTSPVCPSLLFLSAWSQRVCCNPFLLPSQPKLRRGEENKGKTKFTQTSKSLFFNLGFHLIWLWVGGNAFDPFIQAGLSICRGCHWRLQLPASSLKHWLASSYTQVYILSPKISLQVRHSKQAVRSICKYQKIGLFRALKGTGHW